ncbi:hypothetical protein PLEOSDRAFT_1090048 [Pleurotus ostreatus PC15]|uniref:Uncharacterized protein n=1 Tax=Pleurotus ostreatus (strain PC15) TaxID=1137138 RepID=A0A067NER3_PLEO1|nr:hypothetical protein PLEOSDRAFT_1090048 [Pleurotus ostreatus PC15]
MIPIVDASTSSFSSPGPSTSTSSPTRTPAMTEPISSASPSSSRERRPEAEPLPSKRGEIGYREEDQVAGPSDSNNVDVPMPSRHPADRDLPPPPAIHVSAASTDNLPSSASSISSTDTTTRAKANQKLIFGFFNKSKVYWGVRLATLLTLAAQVIILGGTIAAWVVAVQRVQPGSSSGRELKGTSSFIFVHVVFAIATLGQLLFIERRIFRLRAERYAHLHAGEMLPTSRRFGHNPHMDSLIALSPWNRPPLPTYASALAQSGVGTGDVEDHLIAAPPPPAYGNTRGSTLLLAGFLPNSSRAQRPRSQASQASQVRADSDDRPSRPVSYMSRDEEWDTICDAERARRLEATLSRLERPSSRLSQQSRTSRR